MADVQDYFADLLERGVAAPGWLMWYLLAGEVGRRRLLGVVGHYGEPDPDGWTTVGYAICPDDEGLGFASEALTGLIGWGQRTGRLTGWRATTFERHHASVRVLEKNGFACLGVSSEDGDAAEADRQGRGRLMIWERRNI